MPVYTLRHTDTSKTPIVVYPKSLDGPGANRRNSDLRLYGQGAELWGEGVDENLLRLLENFASPEVSPGVPDPTTMAAPNEGQLWFNSTDKHIYVYKAEGSPSQWESFAGVSDVYLKAESDARYVEVAGDTMTGALILNTGSPIVTLQAAPKGYVDAGDALNVTLAGDTMTGALILNTGSPIVNLQAAPRIYVDTTVAAAVAAIPEFPAGVTVPFGGVSLPAGWLFCDGVVKNRTTYADLFAAIGINFGAGDGSTTFGIPNLTGRTVIGTGGTAAPSIGNVAGAETVTLSLAQMPSHSHTATTGSAGSHTHNLEAYFKNHVEGDHGSSGYILSNGSSGQSGLMTDPGNHTHSVTTNSQGSSSAHNNMQPSLAMNWIIKT